MRYLFSRGQLNFEYLALAGILLAILIPVIYASLSTVYDYYKITRVEDVVFQIVSKADSVYKLGPGNKDSLKVIIPSGITGATVAGNEIALQTILRKQNTTVRKFTESHVIGSFDIVQGEYFVPIKAINQSLVRIGSGALLLYMNPACIGAPNFADPPNITIYGDDFTSSALLERDGVPFNPVFYQLMNAGEIIFTAHPTEFTARPTGPPFLFRVRDQGKVSNELPFLVYPNPNKCS